MYLKYIICPIGICMLCLQFVSCHEGKRHVQEGVGSDSVAVSVKTAKPSLLLTDEELAGETQYSDRVDELFDDFLYSYVHDKELQHKRTKFPLKERLSDGSTRTVSEDMWHDVFEFMDKDYTTTIYNNAQEKVVNEDMALTQASLEKIDLVNQMLTSYDFVKEDGKWILSSVRNLGFNESDLSDFLNFYTIFSRDTAFRKKSLARSIRISMTDPENETQMIEGFITRDQWTTVDGGMPEGIITNIRYGQKYKRARKILMEKISMGNGMSETFFFSKNGRNWELVGYEN